MKKNAYFLLLLMMALICSCSGDKDAENRDEAIKNKTPVVQPEDVHAGSASALAPQDVVPPAEETEILAGKNVAEAQQATPGQNASAPAAPAQGAPAQAAPDQTGGQTRVQPANAAGATASVTPASPTSPNTTATAASAGSPSAGEALAKARQLILVASSDWNASRAGLARYERTGPGAPWKRVGAPEACMLGRNGLGWGNGLLARTDKGPQKREGDGKTPAGVFSLPGAFGSASPKEAAASGVKLPFTQISSDVVCVTDPDSSRFNTLESRGKADWKRSDRMNRDSGVNALGAVIGHNMVDPAPKAGSCVFLNMLDAPGKATGGSVACPAPVIKDILSWLDPKADPVVAILPQQEYERLRPVLGLP